jgi:predicted nucleotidyltransferase
MEPSADEALQRRLGAHLAGRHDVRVAMVFGSRARGTAHTDSDLDLAVEMQGGDLLALGGELSLALGVPVDVVSVLPAEASIPLLEVVLRDGLLVHEAFPGAGASWRTRTLASLETDRPWFATMRDAWLRRVRDMGLSDGQP